MAGNALSRRYTAGLTQLIAPSASSPHNSYEPSCRADAITGTSTGRGMLA